MWWARSSIEESNSIETYNGRDWFQGWGRVTNPQWTRHAHRPADADPAERDVARAIRSAGSSISRARRSIGSLSSRTVRTEPFEARAHRQRSAPARIRNPAAAATTTKRIAPAMARCCRTFRRGSAFAYLNYKLHGRLACVPAGAVRAQPRRLRERGRRAVRPVAGTIYQRQRVPADELRQVMVNEGLQQFGFAHGELRRSRGARPTSSRTTRTLHRRVCAGASSAAGVTPRLLPVRPAIDGDYHAARFRAHRSALHRARCREGSGERDAIVCRSTLFNPSNGCVPINLFGAGARSPGAIDYVLDDKFGHVTVEQQFAEISADGPVAAGIGAGPVLLALGASFREDRFDQYATPADLEHHHAAERSRASASRAFPRHSWAPSSISSRRSRICTAPTR